MSNTARLYVGNIPYTSSQLDFETFFAPRKVLQVKIVTDRETQRPRGFAFVELESEAEAQSAIEQLDGTQMGGRTIVVNLAKEKTNRGVRNDGPRQQRQQDNYDWSE